MYFVNCKRTPQKAKIWFVAESATLIFLFDLLCCFRLHGQIAKTLYCSKSLQKQAISRNPQLYVESANCKRNPQIVSVHLRNPEQLPIFARCGIRNIINVPTQFILELFVRGILWIFVSGIRLQFGAYFKTCLWRHTDTKVCAYPVQSLTS